MPIKEGKVYQLVEYLDSLLAKKPSIMVRLVLERDALLALLLWDSSLRGINCGQVTLSDFFLPEGSSLQLPLADPLPPGSILILRPNGTKTVKGQRSGPYQLTVGVKASHSFLGRLPAFLNERMPPDAPRNSCLFSPLTANRRALRTLAYRHLTLANV